MPLSTSQLAIMFVLHHHLTSVSLIFRYNFDDLYSPFQFVLLRNISNETQRQCDYGVVIGLSRCLLQPIIIFICGHEKPLPFSAHFNSFLRDLSKQKEQKLKNWAPKRPYGFEEID